MPFATTRFWSVIPHHVRLAITLLLVSPAGLSAAAQAEPFVFVANLGSETVSVIDTATRTVVDTIAVGDPIRPTGSAITPDGRFVYLINFQLRSVSVIDTTSNALVKTISLGDFLSFDSAPTGIAIMPDSRLVYVTENTGGLALIDVASNTIVAQRVLQFGDRTLVGGRIVLSGDGSRGYIIGTIGGNAGFIGYGLAALETATNALSSLVQLDQDPRSLVLSSDGRIAYIGLGSDGSAGSRGKIAVLDTSTMMIVASILIGDRPDDLALTSDGRKLYVLDSATGQLSAIDTATSAVSAVPIPGTAAVANVTLDSADRLYATYGLAASPEASAIAVIDTTTDLVTHTIDVGAGDFPGDLMFLPDGNHAYYGAGLSIAMLDLMTHQSRTILTGVWPVFIAATPDGAFAYVVSEVTRILSIIDRVGGRVAARLTLPRSSTHITVSPDGRFAYAATEQGLAIIDVQAQRFVTLISVDPAGTFTNPANAVAFTPDSRRAYVISDPHRSSGFVSVVDTHFRIVTATIPVEEPIDIVLSSDGCTAYVLSERRFAEGLRDHIAVIDTTLNRVVRTIPLAGHLEGISHILLAPDKPVAYVKTFGFSDAMLEVVDLTTGTGEIHPFNNGFDIELTPDGTTLFATDKSIGGVRLIDTATLSELGTMTTGFEPVGIAIAQASRGTGPPMCVSPPPASPTPTVSATPTPDVDPTPSSCSGDCDADGTVAIDELLKSVNILLGTHSLETCTAADQNGDGEITIDEILGAVNRLLLGC